MGFLGFLKPKRKEKGSEHAVSQQLPPLPTDSEFYSELPNLPEAPELSGIPDIDLPQPMKGFDEPEEKPMRRPQMQRPAPVPQPDFKEEWLKSQDYLPKEKQDELPELPPVPKMTAADWSTPSAQQKNEPWLNIPSEMPELKPFQPSEEREESYDAPKEGGTISRNNAFFLNSDDFRMVRNNLDKIAKTQKKHHMLTDLKKEEGGNYDRINSLTEEMQRKLMHIDRTLFE